VNVRRQYRGGYQFAGLAELVRELRKKQTSAEALLWQLLRNRQLLGSNSDDNISLAITSRTSTVMTRS
jgi:very-short-patch-repair endonuclease